MAVMCLNTGKQQKHSPLQLLAATCKKIGRPTSPLLDKRPPAKKLYQPYNYVPNSPPISPPNNDNSNSSSNNNNSNESNSNNNSNNNSSSNNTPGSGTPISVQCESSYQSPSSPSLKLSERSDIRFSVSPISPNSNSSPHLGERDNGHTHQLPAMPSPRGHDMRGGRDNHGHSPRGHDIHAPSVRCQDIRGPSPIRIPTAMMHDNRLHSPRSLDMRHSPRGQDMRGLPSRGQDMRGHSPRGQENAHMRGHWKPGDMDRSRISPPSMSTPPPGSKVSSCTACAQGLCCDRGRRVPSHPPTLTPPRSPYPQRNYYPVQPSPHSPHPNTAQHPPPPTSPRVLINSHNMTSQPHMTSHHHHLASHEQKQSASTPPPSEIYHHPHMFSRRIVPPLGTTYGTPAQRFAMRPNPPQGPVTTATRTRRRCECPNCVGGNQNMSSSKPKQHICHIPGCGKVYGKTSHLRAHLRWHAGLRPFICNWLHCGKSFTRSDELQRHLKTHTGEKRFACSECDKRFLRSDHLSKHMKTHQNKAAAQAAQAKVAEAELAERKIEDCDSEEDETVDVELLPEDVDEN